MKISIVTPAFNSAKTIEKTINSVISQKQANLIEYIVIDGASTDETLEILKKYEKHIDIFISEPDMGAYDAMNKGVSRATGDVIGIINSDDWYNDGAIKIVEKEFTNQPDIDILYSPIDNYYSGEYLATFIPGDLDKLPIKFTLNHPSCFIKKSAYDTVGLYDLQYKIAADYDLILRLFLSNCKFHYVNTPLAAYSLNGMSSSSNPWDRAKLIKECWTVSTKTCQQFGQNPNIQRTKIFAAFILNEIFALPVRHYLRPPNARKLKIFLSKYIKRPIPDNYGKW